MSCDESCKVHEYSVASVLLHNVPYLVMLLLGAAVLKMSLAGWAWPAAVGYGVYGVLGAFWIILFICPHCPSYGRWSCPCGYGVVASRLRAADDRSLFARKFKRHILFIVPLWFIPLLVGVPVVIKSFSWMMIVLMAAFAVNSFVVLPMVSTGEGCKECPQRDECPWMGKKESAEQAA